MSSKAMANNNALAATLQKAHELHNNGEHNTMQQPLEEKHIFSTTLCD